MEFELTETQSLIRNMVKEFAEKELVPTAEKFDDERIFPEDALKKLAALNMFGILVPQNYGGANLDTISFSLIIEELARGSASTAITVSIHNSSVCFPIVKFGNDEQKQKYLPKLANGEKLGAFALTEIDIGSDFLSIKTTAEKDGDYYIINGKKAFFTNGDKADILLVGAKTGESISLFIVEKGEGITTEYKDETLGFRSSDTAILDFKDVKIPKENLLGNEGDCLKIYSEISDLHKIGMSSIAVGVTQASMEASSIYANTRVQFGRPIGTFQAIQSMIGDMAIELEASRLLVHKASFLRDKGMDITIPVSIAKIYSSETAIKSADNAIQVHGGYGFTKEFPAERYFRDALGTSICGGSGDLQRLIVAKDILKKFK